MKIGIVCYPTFGGSGVVATELGIGLADKRITGSGAGADGRQDLCSGDVVAEVISGAPA